MNQKINVFINKVKYSKLTDKNGLLKLNLISVLLSRMILSLGVGRVDGVLARLGVPEKLRILLLLSTRCIFILAERAGTMVRAVQLRGPGLKGIPMCRTFACVLGTTLEIGRAHV